MDTMKLLLGATVAVLLGALCWSFVGMKEGEKNAPADEIARLQKQVNELRIEQERIQLEKNLQQVRSSQPVQAPAAAPSPDLDAMKAEIAAKDAALKQIEDEKNKAQRDADTYKDEAGFIGQRDLEKSNNELRRARLIKDALLVARVKEFAEDPTVGSFATVEILMPETVQVGTIVAIRRNTGILGQLKISDISPEGAIANPMPGFGQVKPEPGDELILPPQY
jgi:hypothetical protein